MIKNMLERREECDIYLKFIDITVAEIAQMKDEIY